MARLTPLDLRKQEFKQSALGLNKDQVHDFLEMAAEEFEVLIRERSVLQDDLKDLQSELDKYKEIEHSMHAALVMARESATQAVKAAEMEADAILSQARTEKSALLFAAKDQLNDIQNEIRDLKLKRDGFIMNFKTILNTHLSALTAEFSQDAIMAEPKSSPTPTPSSVKPAQAAPVISHHEERIIDFSKSDLTLSDLDDNPIETDSVESEEKDRAAFEDALDFDPNEDKDDDIFVDEDDESNGK